MWGLRFCFMAIFFSRTAPLSGNSYDYIRVDFNIFFVGGEVCHEVC